MTPEERRGQIFAAFKAMWQFYVWNDEPLKAEALLDHAPALIDDAPELAELRSVTAYHLRHAHNWNAYCKCYESLPPEVYRPQLYDLDEHRSRGRMEAARATLGDVPLEGPMLRCLAIGPQDCILERDLLTMNPRFSFTLSESCTHAVQTLSDLQSMFPGRVTVHRPEGFYDWPEGPFDVILLLEVIEHLPSQERALRELCQRLAPAGMLLLSTPVAGFWGNMLIADYDWWEHLHSNSSESLIRKLNGAGLRGHLTSTDEGQFFFAVLGAAP